MDGFMNSTEYREMRGPDDIDRLACWEQSQKNA